MFSFRLQASKIRRSVSRLKFKHYSKSVNENNKKSIFTTNSSCKDYTEEFRPKIHLTTTTFVEALSKATIESLDAGISVIRLSDNIKFPIEGLGLGPDSLFIRSYYPQLLSKVRSFQRVCLIGNP